MAQLVPSTRTAQISAHGNALLQRRRCLCGQRPNGHRRLAKHSAQLRLVSEISHRCKDPCRVRSSPEAGCFETLASSTSTVLLATTLSPREMCPISGGASCRGKRVLITLSQLVFASHSVTLHGDDTAWPTAFGADRNAQKRTVCFAAAAATHCYCTGSN